MVDTKLQTLLAMCVAPSKLIIVYDLRLRTYLSDKVHLMGYRLCVRSLTGIITYHNRYGIINVLKQIFLTENTAEQYCCTESTMLHLQ